MIQKTQPIYVLWLKRPVNQTSRRLLPFIYLYFLLSFNSLSQANSRDPYFDRIMSENIKIERGISQNSIVSIVQDEMGFMWFGTFDGLNRFDGYEFTIFNKEQGLSNETITCLLQTGDSIWVGTENGLNLVNLCNDSIERFFNKGDENNSLSDNVLNSIYKDHNGALWVCTNHGLDALDRSTNSFKRFTNIESKYGLSAVQYKMVIQDKESNYYIATNHGLFVIDRISGLIERYIHQVSDKFSLPDNQVNTLAFDSQQQLYVGTKKGLVTFIATSKSFQQIDLNSIGNKALNTDEITCLTNETSSGIWIGTYANGLFFIDNETNLIKGYQSNQSYNYSLTNNRVLSVYQSKDGIVWIGTFNGLNKFDRDAPKFRSYRTTFEYLTGFSSNQVWSFLAYSTNEFLVGTDNGMSIFNRMNGKYTQSEEFNGKAVGLKNKQIRCLFKDRNNHYWIGTRHDGLYRYDPVSGKRWVYTNDPSDKGSISNNFILDIIEDKFGRIWIATGNGLNRMDNDRKGFVQFYYNDSDFNSLADNKLYDLYLNKDGELWISTANGLAIFNEKTEDFTTYKIPDNGTSENNSSSNSFYSVIEDGEGIIWLGTRGGGLVRFDRKENQFKILTMNDGLPDNVVYLVIEDRFKDIWVTTNWGISRYNRLLQSFTNFDVTDGLQCNEFNWNAGYVAQDGEIFIGGMNGFNAFYPEEIIANPGKQNIQITAFKKFNILQNKALHDQDTLWLNHEDNFFSFGFSALDFTNPSKNVYRFMLKGYDSKWIEKKADNRIAEYTRVPPGTYRFLLMASNVYGQWPEKGMEITIIIKPPWYSTWVFRIMVVIIISILFYTLIVIRMRFLRKKHDAEKQYYAIEKKLYQLEQKALQLQMNPHFLFNSLNSIQGLILGNDIDGAIHYLSKFSQLMRKTLSNSGESFIPLIDELNALTLFIEIESFRFGDRFDFTINIDPKIDQEFIEIPPMILQPYVENAIVHGLLNSKHKGNLLIELVLDGKNLLCLIQDDGVGRKRATEIRNASGIEQKPKGMSITSERLSILNQFSDDSYSVKITDLFDENGNASGTRVELNIVMKQ